MTRAAAFEPQWDGAVVSNAAFGSIIIWDGQREQDTAIC